MAFKNCTQLIITFDILKKLRYRTIYAIEIVAIYAKRNKKFKFLKCCLLPNDRGPRSLCSFPETKTEKQFSF